MAEMTTIRLPPRRRALGFIAREGPATSQDRWEEDHGINTFTAAVTITEFESRHWEAQPWLQSIRAAVRSRVR